jgi:6-phosphofructokinase 2
VEPTSHERQKPRPRGRSLGAARASAPTAGPPGGRPRPRPPRDLPILTITVNPALDITTWVPRVVPMQKLRCAPPLYEPGGGGVNVSRAIKELGGASRAFIALGGATGERYRELLAPFGLDAEIWPIPGETRFSLTVMESERRQQYRFLLPGPAIGGETVAALLAEIRRQVEMTHGLVVLSGSPPPGLPMDFAGRLAAHARQTGSRAILDLSGPALKDALEYKPFLVRMNHIEAQELLGSREAAEPLARRAAHTLVQRGGAENVIVTIGEGGAILATGKELLLFRPPHVEVVSAVGAGDSFTGALALGLAKGWDLAEACRFGVAAAASAVTGRSTELCKRPQTLSLLAQMPARPEHLAV